MAALGRRVKKEAELIAAHVIVVLLPEFTILMIGSFLLLLNWSFPVLQTYFSLTGKWDIWIFLAGFAKFATYTVIRVAIRLCRGIIQKWRG